MGTDAPDHLIVIGASAGGIEPLRTVVAGLPAGLEATVLVVLHVSPRGTSVLPEILTRSGPLRAHHAYDGEILRAGEILVAPPDHHLAVGDGAATLDRGPKENGHRPAVNRLFRTAADAYGDRVVGVVLSGSRDDGTAGLAQIAAAGGITVVQEPGTAMHPSMPASALDRVAVDHVVKPEEMARLLSLLVGAGRAPEGGAEPKARSGSRLAPPRPPGEGEETPGFSALHLKAVSCPDCGGVLVEQDDGPHAYRCLVGHRWSADSLVDQQAEELERALWTALRTLEERKILLQRLADHAVGHGRDHTARRFQQGADGCSTQAQLILRALHGPGHG